MILLPLLRGPYRTRLVKDFYHLISYKVAEEEDKLSLKRSEKNCQSEKPETRSFRRCQTLKINYMAHIENHIFHNIIIHEKTTRENKKDVPILKKDNG